MNLQEKQQRLRALIPTSNKLTFGCEIITSTDDGDRRTTIIHPVIKKNSKKYLGDRIKVVIGHPPAERDLLRVLNDAFCGGVYMGTVGIFHYFSPNVRRTLCNYDLTADPLSQDEETTDKLLELLNPKGNTIK